MRGAWHRFWAWPDDQRARFLAQVLAGGILVLLYLLGGASLYVRWRYLVPENSEPIPTFAAISPDLSPSPESVMVEPTLVAVEPTATATTIMTLEPQPSLFPTITPGWYHAGPSAPTPFEGASEGSTTSGSPRATETPFPTPTLMPPTETPRPEPSATLTHTPEPQPTATGLGPPPTRQGR